MDTVRTGAMPVVFSVIASAIRCLRVRLTGATLLVALVSCAAFAADNPALPARGSVKEVVFVCEHGSAKSLVAASIFNRIAQDRGLAIHAVSRAAGAQTVDKSVPDIVARSMAQDGFQVASFSPQPLGSDEAARADHIVLIYDGPVEAASGLPVERWDGIAPVSSGYANARSALQSRVEALIVKLGSSPGKGVQK